MSQLIPLQDNVIVRPIQDEMTTESGIIIPDTVNKEKPMKGEIVAIGPGKEGQNMSTVSVGDVVVFTKYAPTELKVSGEEFYIIGFDSLLAIEK